MNYLICTLLTGITATMVMDLWGALRKPLFGIPAADYRLVGRWVSHLARGGFQHESIAASPAVKGEALTGWIAHYVLGIAFAATLLTITQPDLAPALIFGIATVAVPFLVMQPAMGMGLAASRTPRPGAARLQSLITHAVFGLGLYAGGVVTSLLC